MWVQFSKIVLKDEVNESGQNVNVYGGKYIKWGLSLGAYLE